MNNNISRISDRSTWNDPSNFDGHGKPGAGGSIKPYAMQLTVPAGRNGSVDWCAQKLRVV